MHRKKCTARIACVLEEGGPPTGRDASGQQAQVVYRGVLCNAVTDVAAPLLAGDASRKSGMLSIRHSVTFVFQRLEWCWLHVTAADETCASP